MSEILANANTRWGVYCEAVLINQPLAGTCQQVISEVLATGRKVPYMWSTSLSHNSNLIFDESDIQSIQVHTTEFMKQLNWRLSSIDHPTRVIPIHHRLFVSNGPHKRERSQLLACYSTIWTNPINPSAGSPYKSPNHLKSWPPRMFLGRAKFHSLLSWGPYHIDHIKSRPKFHSSPSWDHYCQINQIKSL